MKITKVDIYMLDATAQRASRRPICCRVWTDEGFYGDGEAGIAFDYASTCGDRHAPGISPVWSSENILCVQMSCGRECLK